MRITHTAILALGLSLPLAMVTRPAGADEFDIIVPAELNFDNHTSVALYTDWGWLVATTETLTQADLDNAAFTATSSNPQIGVDPGYFATLSSPLVPGDVAGYVNPANTWFDAMLEPGETHLVPNSFFFPFTITAAVGYQGTATIHASIQIGAHRVDYYTTVNVLDVAPPGWPSYPELLFPVAQRLSAVLVPGIGCADGGDEQMFGSDMVGCGGVVSYPNRNNLCAAGWDACTTAEWVDRFDGQAPTYDYWTADNLRYTGTAGSCGVSTTTGGTACSPGTPMRVCTPLGTDPLGNQCNWTFCDSTIRQAPEHTFGVPTIGEQFFGGCYGNPTAGTLCCSQHGCADGSDEQVFSSSMVGCGGQSTFANRATLCAPGWSVCTVEEFESQNSHRKVPTYDYWTDDDLRFGGTSFECWASTTEGDTSCSPNSPMRVCAWDVMTDPLGNLCNWHECSLWDVETDPQGTHLYGGYYGGCDGNDTAGALCCSP